MRPRARAGLLAALLGVGLGVLAPAPAYADPDLRQARAQADQLRAQVEALQVQAEVATEHYDEITAQLAALATREGLARRQLDQARAASDGELSEVQQRARAIYMSGGRMGLYASLLDGSDVSDLLVRYQAVQTVMDLGAADQQRAAGVADRAAAIALEIGRLADRASALEAQAQAAADEVTTTLDRSQQMLAEADATVRRLVDEQQRRAEEAAAAASRARFAQLGLLTGGAGAPNPVAARAVQVAETALGRPYVWGATGPGTFDCSGLTGWAYRQAGLSLPRTSRQQWYVGRHVALADLAPGDLLFWATDIGDPRTIHHVALYIGDGQMLEAPHTGAVVRTGPVRTDGLIGAVRPTG